MKWPWEVRWKETKTSGEKCWAIRGTRGHWLLGGDRGGIRYHRSPLKDQREKQFELHPSLQSCGGGRGLRRAGQEVEGVVPGCGVLLKHRIPNAAFLSCRSQGSRGQAGLTGA